MGATLGNIAFVTSVGGWLISKSGDVDALYQPPSEKTLTLCTDGNE